MRIAVAADAPAIEAIYAPVVRDSTISFEWDPPSAAEIAGRIERTRTDNYPWLVAEIDGSIASYAYASRFRTRAAYDWTVEVSVYVDRAHQRSGVGRLLYGELLRVLERQGYRSAYGVMTLPNAPSEALHRALGFTEVGRFQRVGWKFGAWYDVAVWHIALGDGDAAPGAIAPVALP